MSRTPLNARSAWAICARFIARRMFTSKVQDFTQPISDAEKTLAYGLWSYYETDMPDTPIRVARVMLYVLNKNGFEVIKK